MANPRAEIFIDIDKIPLGLDFADDIDGKVGQTEILLALIGHDWLDARDPKTGRLRLDDPKDFVRLEIASALAGFGVPGDRIVTEARGASQLAVATDQMVHEPLNRRVDVRWDFEPWKRSFPISVKFQRPGKR